MVDVLQLATRLEQCHRTPETLARRGQVALDSLVGAPAPCSPVDRPDLTVFRVMLAFGALLGLIASSRSHGLVSMRSPAAHVFQASLVAVSFLETEAGVQTTGRHKSGEQMGSRSR